MTVALLLLGGFVLLIAGGEALVRGASKLAVSLGLSPLVVGLTVVAFWTSSPELAVSVQAALKGEVDIAMGNVVGSNVFNVLFILGLSALIAPLIVTAQVVRQEVPIMIGASVLLYALADEGDVGLIEGMLLAALLVTYTVFLVVQSRRASQATQAEYAASPRVVRHQAWDDRLPMQLALIAGGLVALAFGSRWLVEGATTIAAAMGVSELVIGLTIVAVGTSLPEVAASVTATLRGQRDIAVGNVVGSNTFNVLGVLGVSAIVAPDPLTVSPSLVTFDMLVMITVALACLPVFLTNGAIARWEGAVFLAYYVGYTAFLILASQQHDLLLSYGLAINAVVLPLTLLTTAVVVWRLRRPAGR